MRGQVTLLGRVRDGDLIMLKIPGEQRIGDLQRLAPVPMWAEVCPAGLVAIGSVCKVLCRMNNELRMTTFLPLDLPVRVRRR